MPVEGTQGEDGLSLVEMMVAILILGFILSALAQSLVVSLRAVRGQERTTTATAAINDILEEAQRVEYDAAALCKTTAETYFGGSTFGGEPLVLSPAVCGTPDEIAVERTVTRDGVDYDVVTAITWFDDAEDGTGAGDSDSPQDVKRIIVDINWTADGQPRSARNMAFRAPQFHEQLLSGGVTADDGSEFVAIDAGSGWNSESFTIRAAAREKMSTVKVSWVDRDGNTETKTLTPTTSENIVWEHHVSANFGPFANGGTIFTFEGVSSAGEAETILSRGLFLSDPMTADLKFVGPLRVGPAGVCPAQPIHVDVVGAVASDVVTATWQLGPAAVESFLAVDATGETIDVRGARFELDLEGRTDFAPGTHQLRARVERVVDASVIEKELTTFQVVAVDAC